MKTLKLNHTLAKAIIRGDVRLTWRLLDEKNISVGDEIELIDQVDQDRPNTWHAIGVAHVDEVTEKRVREVTAAELAASGTESRDYLLAHYQRYYSDVSPDSPVKIIRFRFEPYAGSPQAVYRPEIPQEIQLFADGGSRGNPGHSAAGYVLLDMQGNVLKKSGVYLGITTNNQAEYQALKYGLEDAARLGALVVHVHMDSMLVVNQMKRIFKVKNRDLWPIHSAIQDLVERFREVHFTHVPRELNKLADAEVNQTLDAELKH